MKRAPVLNNSGPWSWRRKITFALEVLLAIGATAIAIRTLHFSKATVQSERSLSTRFAWVSTRGILGESFDATGRYLSPRESVDGSSVFLTRLNPGGRSSWVLYMSKRTIEPFGAGKTTLQLDLTSPDGERVAFSKYEDRDKIYLSSSRITAQKVFQELTYNLNPLDWTRNGRWMAVAGTNLKRTGLWIVPGQGGEGSLVLATDFANPDARFSPEGKWLALTSNRSGQDEIYIVAVPDPGGTLNVDGSSLVRISMHGGHTPEWGRTDGELYYLNNENDLIEVSGITTAARPTGEQKLFRMTSLGGPNYEYAFDGYCVDRMTDQFLILLRKSIVRP